MKKVQSISSLFAMSVFCSFAANASQQAIPSNRLDDYKTAIATAVSNDGLRCDGAYSTGDTLDYISHATSGTVQNDSSQPLITLTYKGNGDQQVVLTITTSSDLKSIQTLKVEEQGDIQVFSGNLANPVYTPAYGPTGEMSVCSHN